MKIYSTAFIQTLAQRNTQNHRARLLCLGAVIICIGVLLVLFLSIINQAFGLIAVTETIPVETVTSKPFDQMEAAELEQVFATHLGKGKLLGLLVKHVLGEEVDRSALGTTPLRQLVPEMVYPEETGDRIFADLTPEEIASIVVANLPRDQVIDLIYSQVIGRTVLQSWGLWESLFERSQIEQEVQDKALGIGFASTLSQKQLEEIKAQYANAHLETQFWLSPNFLTKPLNSVPSEAGIRPAIAGSLWVLAIAMPFATILGIGMAIYLEEYVKRDSEDSRIWRLFNSLLDGLLQNLAAVPSVIYGLVGLAVFVRTMGFLTQGRTILSAGLTLGCLGIPVIYINTREALKAVTESLRLGSTALGLSKWGTIRRLKLPIAMPGIMTGMILSLSRIVGETAPVLMIGAVVSLSRDPSGPFSTFTTLPVIIYNWATQPNDQFRNIASATILLLLVLISLLNFTAIKLRQSFERRLQT